MNSQFKKGILEMCVLMVLKDQDWYGYDLLKCLRDYFEDLRESTLYTILRRLETEGKTHTYMSSLSKGPKRKYYQLTDQGRTYLDQCLGEWDRMQELVNQLKVDKGGQ